MSKEIVLYRKYGVFSLSSKAVQWLMKERNWSCTTFTEEHKPLDFDADIIYKAPGTTFGYAKEGYHINWFKHQTDDIPFRTNTDVIDAVRTLGTDASNDYDYSLEEKINPFEIVAIPTGYRWRIKCHDGFETIAIQQEVEY